jgi:hypothetical protein
VDACDRFAFVKDDDPVRLDGSAYSTPWLADASTPSSVTANPPAAVGGGYMGAAAPL